VHLFPGGLGHPLPCRPIEPFHNLRFPPGRPASGSAVPGIAQSSVLHRSKMQDVARLVRLWTASRPSSLWDPSFSALSWSGTRQRAEPVESGTAMRGRRSACRPLPWTPGVECRATLANVKEVLNIPRGTGLDGQILGQEDPRWQRLRFLEEGRGWTSAIAFAVLSSVARSGMPWGGRMRGSVPAKPEHEGSGNTHPGQDGRAGRLQHHRTGCPLGAWGRSSSQ